MAGRPRAPQEYWHTHDPFVALATAAAATTSLKLGTGICLVTERDPIVTAKCVASLDVMSKGRFLFGIGAGWNAEEMENHGTDFKSRFALMSERVLAMKQIWTVDEPEFHGKFVNFDPIWAFPNPFRSRIRRSSWAVRPATRSSASSTTAAAGSRAGAATSTSRPPWPI